MDIQGALPLRTGGYYPPGGQYGQAVDYMAAPGGRQMNPTVHIPRTVPPGSAIAYNSVKISEPLIAMTFDDGPHPSHTPRLLDILAQRNVKATFFVVGSRVQSHPHIIARMVREGHEVANHTWNHPDLTKISDAMTRSELQRTAHAIHSACGLYPRTYRPPYGAITERHRRWIHGEFGYPTVTWNVDPKDWQRPGPSVVASRLVAGARNGAILLAHDIHGGTVSAIPSALDQLLSRGFRFVTVTQLINAATFGTALGQEEPAGPAASAGDAILEKKPQTQDELVTAGESGLAVADRSVVRQASEKLPEHPLPSSAELGVEKVFDPLQAAPGAQALPVVAPDSAREPLAAAGQAVDAEGLSRTAAPDAP